MKKKYTVSLKDKKDWIDFTKQIGDLSPKEDDFTKEVNELKKVPKLDLHGFSLNESNEIVKKFITKCYHSKFSKILVVTGKGKRSKSSSNPYVSEKLSVLRYAVPEFIENDSDLKKKIKAISKADLRDGGDGAIYIFLKNNRKLKE